MSLLLNDPSKLCFRKPLLVRSSPLLSNGVSSQNPLSVIMYVDPCGADLGKLVIRRAGDITPLEKKMSLKEMGMIGSSHGWLATLKDGFVGLQNPVASDTDPKHISLPPLVTLPHCQTRIVTNVAMSSPAQRNPEWINIRVGSPCFFSSPVMFSKKDDRFHVLGSGGHLTGSWDHHTQTHKPKFNRFFFKTIPHLTKANKELLDSCFKSEHFVESRTTNETFVVKQYKKTAEIINGTARMKTVAVMVFKLDNIAKLFYTQDIGDLCIFLTKYETFCVPSSSFPGLFPNHVKILDSEETAIVNLADQKWNF
ncbi:unnamed protein product [Arabidopsis thaliana]|nr:unnamed protein product [Arabidopsis thaliana]